MYNLLMGGAAGDGIETMSALLEKLLKKSGFHVFTTRDFMSRIRGGHNFVQIRFGYEPLDSHCDTLNGIFAMNKETYDLHQHRLRTDGFIICDTSIAITDGRALLLPLYENARTLGNTKVATGVAIGAILSLFGIPAADYTSVLKKSLKSTVVDVNRQAIEKGQLLTKPRFTHTPQQLNNHMLLSGTTAVALGAVAAGVKFYAAYPMSPSTGILEYLSGVSEELHIVVEQAEDEIAAINMAIGAAYAGAPAMTGTSGGGLCLMVEALGFAGIAEIPLVIVNVQRPGPATGLPTRTEQSDLKFAINASQGEFPRMVIALRHHEDAFNQTVRAFHLARKYQMPIIILSDQYLGDATATVPVFQIDKTANDINDNGEIAVPYQRYEENILGISPLLFPGKSEHLVRADSDEHDAYGLISESAVIRKKMMDKRLGKLKLLEADLQEPAFFGDEACTLLLVGFGSMYGPLKEAVLLLQAQGYAAGALLFGDIFPLPKKRLTQYATQAKRMISVEQNATAQLASLICEATALTCCHSILKYDGRQLSADDMINALKRYEGESQNDR